MNVQHVLSIYGSGMAVSCAIINSGR